MSDQEINNSGNSIRAKIDNYVTSTQTHDYDGYLGEIYHHIQGLKSHSDQVMLSFDLSLSLIEHWINQSQHRLDELSHIDWESVKLLQNLDVILTYLDLTAIETEKLLTWQRLNQVKIPQEIKILLRSRVDVKLKNMPNINSCRRTLYLLKTDLLGNSDHCNHIEVSELLPQVIELIKDESDQIHQEFLISWADISLHGSCAQGRTSRLLNFYIPYHLNLIT